MLVTVVGQGQRVLQYCLQHKSGVQGRYVSTRQCHAVKSLP